MSAATSPGTGLAYGLQRVCAAWGFARSSFYAMKSRQQASAERAPAKRRGPKPAVSDQALLVAIEADLEASPWEGEGHRKVWARLRVCRGIRVSRKRVLRVMRENNLLSPHRGRRRGGNPHDGEIVTHAPNLMWGTDGVRVFTVDDGWGWIFTAIEHWNAECVGWHVCKRGDRFAALQPISMGLARLCGLAPVWWRACCSRPASHLELDRALVAERRVPPDRIVEPVDVSSHRVLGLAAGLPGDRPDQLGLDGLEERLDHSVVVAVALSTHRDQQVMFSQHRLIVDGAILGGFNRSSQHVQFDWPASTGPELRQEFSIRGSCGAVY